jgi:hypothetical protein
MLRRCLFFIYLTTAGVMAVLDNAMIEPDALAIVIEDKEKPISSRYVISVAEYARTVSCSSAPAIDAGQIAIEK